MAYSCPHSGHTALLDIWNGHVLCSNGFFSSPYHELSTTVVSPDQVYSVVLRRFHLVISMDMLLHTIRLPQVHMYTYYTVTYYVDIGYMNQFQTIS